MSPPPYVNYLRKISHSLARHARQDVRKLKRVLMDSETLRFYDFTKGVTLQVDASQHGLGAALIQDDGPVAFVSRAMNDTQRQYA
jgi:hypothetical protein